MICSSKEAATNKAGWGGRGVGEREGGKEGDNRDIGKSIHILML